jgi:hypothetical protein
MQVQKQLQVALSEDLDGINFDYEEPMEVRVGSDWPLSLLVAHAR